MFQRLEQEWGLAQEAPGALRMGTVGQWEAGVTGGCLVTRPAAGWALTFSSVLPLTVRLRFVGLDLWIDSV